MGDSQKKQMAGLCDELVVFVQDQKPPLWGELQSAMAD